MCCPAKRSPPKQPVLTVVDLATAGAGRCSVGTHEVSRIAPGMATGGAASKASTQPVQGRIARIAPAAEPGTRSIAVTIELANPRRAAARRPVRSGKRGRWPTTPNGSPCRQRRWATPRARTMSGSSRTVCWPAAPSRWAVATRVMAASRCSRACNPGQSGAGGAVSTTCAKARKARWWSPQDGRPVASAVGIDTAGEISDKGQNAMWITRVSINNPVFAAMVMVALCVLGLFSLTPRLGVEQMPDINFPGAWIEVPYPGASPEAVERETDQAAGGSRQRRRRRQAHHLARARRARAQANIEFGLDADMGRAMQDVRDRVAAAQSSFPDATCQGTDDRALEQRQQRSPSSTLALLSSPRAARASCRSWPIGRSTSGCSAWKAWRVSRCSGLTQREVRIDLDPAALARLRRDAGRDRHRVEGGQCRPAGGHSQRPHVQRCAAACRRPRARSRGSSNTSWWPAAAI
jgi:hypothetical protein